MCHLTRALCPRVVSMELLADRMNLWTSLSLAVGTVSVGVFALVIRKPCKNESPKELGKPLEIEIVVEATAADTHTAPPSPPPMNEPTTGLMPDLPFHLTELLSDGTFSTTYAARIDNVATRVKVYKPATDPQVLDTMRVMETLMHNPHQHVVHVLDFNLNSIPRFLVLRDDAASVPLATLLSHGGPLPVPTARSHVIQVCEALGHLHSLDILYRGLCTDHVLIDSDGQLTLDDCEFSIQRSAEDVLTFAGVPEYMAPEMLLAEEYSTPADFWALGCLTCAMLTCDTPFSQHETVEALLHNILYDEIGIPLRAHIGPSETTFIMALLTRDPQDRLGGTNGHAEVLAHEWVRM